MMNLLLLACIGLTAWALIGAAIMLHAQKTAPYGWEDADGFHRGRLSADDWPEPTETGRTWR